MAIVVKRAPARESRLGHGRHADDVPAELLVHERLARGEPGTVDDDERPIGHDLER